MTKPPTFRQWLIAQEMSDTTVHGYALNVAGFETWYCQTNGAREIDPAAVTRADVRDYRGYLERQRKAPATINRYLQALHTWGKWLMETGQRADNPAADTRRVPEAQLAPHWPERKQVAALERELERAVNNARTDSAKFLAVRDRAMVALLAHTGLRVAELCALGPGDLKLSERAGLLTVRHGKGNKQRRVPVNNEARRALAPWLELRPPAAGHVFSDLAGANLQPRGVQRALKDYCRRAGVSITPHQLRHYLAKSLVDAGTPAATVAAILGHNSLDTTRRYTLPSQRDMERAVENLET